MRAWQSPEVPSLEAFGKAPEVALFDTASRRVRTSEPEGRARLYVCGITPYDATHLGHAATYLTYDLLIRRLEDLGQYAIRGKDEDDLPDFILIDGGKGQLSVLVAVLEELGLSSRIDAAGIVRVAVGIGLAQFAFIDVDRHED